MSVFAIVVIAIVAVTAIKLAGKPTEKEKQDFEEESDFIDMMEDLDAIDDD